MARTRADTVKKGKQTAFLKAYAELGVISYACAAADVGRSTYYEWRDDDPEFRARADEAKEDACDMLEREATRRAVEGTAKPVYQGGEKVGTVQEYSDTLLIFLMKGARPQTYRDRYIPTAPAPEGVGASPQTLDGLMGRFQEFVTSEAAAAYLQGRAEAEDEQPAAT